MEFADPPGCGEVDCLLLVTKMGAVLPTNEFCLSQVPTLVKARSSLTTNLRWRLANPHPAGRRSFPSRPLRFPFAGERLLKVPTLLTAVLLVASFTLTASAEETGDLKIRFEYGGKLFTPKPIDVNKDVEFCGKHGLVQERLLVNKENNGIKNVVVYVYTGRGGAKLPKVDPANNTHTLANQNCRFEPHILITQTGDTLEVTNPDPVGHNANMNFLNNKAENLMIPGGSKQQIALEKAEPAPIPIDCNIHPWMKAYVLVLDHPFAAVSDENGDMVIKGLPVGKKLMFRAYHESGSFKDILVDGEKEGWKRNRFEVDIKEGMNDLGTVVVPAAAFE